MKYRRAIYVVGIFLLATLFSGPQLLLVPVLVLEGIRTRQIPLPAPPGFHPKSHWTPLQQMPFWRDKFVHLVDDPSGWRVAFIDPETGTVEFLDQKLPEGNWFRTVVFGHRIVFVRANESYELINGRLQESNVKKAEYCSSEKQRFNWNGEPTFVETTATEFKVSEPMNGKWKRIGFLQPPMLTEDQMRQSGATSQSLQQGHCEIIHSTDGDHLFVVSERFVFYRKGVEIVDDDQPVSALEATNQADASEWSLVRENPDEFQFGLGEGYATGLLIGGRPAALFVDNARSGNAVGHLYRFDGTTWNEFATHTFPFGSTSFVAVTTDDGQRSYVGARTTYGCSYVFALDASGFRMTEGSGSVKTQGRELEYPPLEDLKFCGILFGGSLLLGSVLGCIICLIMWKWTKANYAFGTQSVKLSSLGWRALARLIDLGLIILSTMAIGWLLTRDFDWRSFAEALNLRADHPTMPIAYRIALVLVVWLITIVVAMVSSQAIWGVTPGKWLCRLRTVQTSLRPCGFARSVAREVVFFVDCCNFVCWTPGIVSIAVTERRQRLGDLVADTIVINSLQQPAEEIEGLAHDFRSHMAVAAQFHIDATAVSN